MDNEEIRKLLPGNTESMFKRVQNMGESIGSALTSVSTKRQTGPGASTKRQKPANLLSMLSISDNDAAAAALKPEITINTNDNYTTSSICYTTLNKGVRTSAFTTPKSDIKIQS